MVVFIPFSADGENQWPHSSHRAARLGWLIHGGLGTGSLWAPGLGGAAVGLGWGDKRVGLNWWGVRREPQGSAREPDVPTVGMGENEERNTDGREGGEGLGTSAPFNKQTVVLRAVASACAPRPLQKRCKITESLLIFSIFC